MISIDQREREHRKTEPRSRLFVRDRRCAVEQLLRTSRRRHGSRRRGRRHCAARSYLRPACRSLRALSSGWLPERVGGRKGVASITAPIGSARLGRHRLGSAARANGQACRSGSGLERLQRQMPLRQSWMRAGLIEPFSTGRAAPRSVSRSRLQLRCASCATRSARRVELELDLVDIGRGRARARRSR